MNTLKSVRTVGLTVIAASLAAGFGSAHAAHGDEFDSFEESLIYHSRPESSVRFGLGYLNEDAARFGQFTGLEEMGLYAIGEVRLVKRDDATGTWLRLDGRNLGLQSRSLRFEHEAQGNWRYIIDYRKSPRYSPYTVNTGLTGIGSSELTSAAIAPGAGRDVSLKTVRESVGLAGEKILGSGFDLKVNFKHETKKGERLFGRGTSLFLAEPIDYEMRQVDVVLGYTGERLQLSGGYYGSFFRNDHNALWVDRTTQNAGAFSPISLPPDNHAHQFHLAGGYSFTPTTRGNFKVSRSVATQNDTFMELFPGQTNISGRRNLGGKVVTTLAQAGISARPTAELSLRANLKYEDRDDKTPVVQYVPIGQTGAGFNHPRDFRQLKGNVEASYRLPENFRITGGVEYDKRTRNSQDIRSVSFRRNTEELSYRVALSRSLGETLNGSIAYVRSERDGSSFQFTRRLNGTDGSNLIAPLHLADRDRDTVRLRLDWMPTEPLSLQFLADISHDKYGGRELGPHKRRAHFLSVDASYAISQDWQGHAWVTRDSSRAINRTRASVANDGTGGTPWQAALRQSGDAVGVGVRGRATEKLELGADLQFSRDRSAYSLSGPSNPDDLPDVKYSLASLKLSGKYALQRDLALRVDLIHDRWRTNDWLWGAWTYADGTTVNQDRKQNATFVGVSVQYNWR
ncbi:MAG TPA: MtrB/PioB family decaheme-associated outer membrane protein [Rhodocyclaceae bacterium]|nr:MtrB/PioB family decaheme-associated outer membrane protein [Rhodocyclaceae bacterium]HRQ46135.1 MtrB/PioB family decaheme-associated outer membrane protein [Rhodocyclaceae bacterium]HRQ46141.1 MtrB/PioB family decaheme-associated outer membrane protein [Rhodocyclaceae bacterium]